LNNPLLSEKDLLHCLVDCHVQTAVHSLENFQHKPGKTDDANIVIKSVLMAFPLTKNNLLKEEYNI
jgi:hypothetical protein